MRRRIPCLSLLPLCCLILLAPSGARAQDWTEAQQEVWQTVQAYNSLFEQGDWDAFFAHFHPDYRGWYVGAPAPSTLAEARQEITQMMQGVTVVAGERRPLAITLYGDVAVVHYTYTQTTRDAGGNETSDAGRWTDVLVKQGDRWVVVADHGGPQPAP